MSLKHGFSVQLTGFGLLKLVLPSVPLHAAAGTQAMTEGQ